MAEKKIKVVHYLNQFFAQIGGEEKADIGFSVEEKAIGPGLILQKELGDGYEVVATLICGDNHFAVDLEKNTAEGLKRIEEFNPDIFIAGPAFTAGRYGMSCGALCKAVESKLNIPAITAMGKENPGVGMFAGNAYIVKCGDSAREMGKVAKDIARLAKVLYADEPDPELVSGYATPSPYAYNYYKRGTVRNIFQEQNTARRSLSLLLKKLKNEPFESDAEVPVLDSVDPPQHIDDVKKARIAFVTDGGLMPIGNPDRFVSRACTVWGEYDLDTLFPEGGEKNYDILHMGYNNAEVHDDYNRMLPVDVARAYLKSGLIGKLNPSFFSTCGNTSVIKRTKVMGEEIAQKILEQEVDAVIVTST